MEGPRAIGIETYGVSKLFVERGDVRAHGKDERILVNPFSGAAPFDLVRAMFSAASA